MTLRIMVLDMHELSCFPERWVVPVQISKPFMGVWVVGADVSDVRLIPSCVSQDTGIREGGRWTLKCCT